MYKYGTGTKGRGHRDAYGTRGRVGRGRRDVKHRDAGTSNRDARGPGMAFWTRETFCLNI